MKYLITILAILFTVSLNAQWSFNTTSGSGIESANNTASGQYSIAMGYGTTASGDQSTAMGTLTTSSDYGTLSIGSYNTDDASPNPTLISLANRAFIIGNGTSTSNKSDALEVLFDGTTTIAGTVTAASFISEGCEASGSRSIAIGRNTIASSYASIAMGDETTASGSNSTAMGEGTTANGDTSIAMGFETTASGNESTAMGTGTTASGKVSTAMGTHTTASDYGTLAIGIYNTDDTTPNPSTFSLANRAFIIGNGVNNSNKSDAMTVLFDGTTTIVGSVTAESFISLNSQVTGDNATAFGVDNTASGNQSFAVGYFNEAIGHNSVAMGTYTEATGHNSFAFGDSSKSIGSNSAAIGNAAETNGLAAAAFNNHTIANGNYSSALGNYTTADDLGAVSIGQYNTADASPNPGSFSLVNRAFIIGNGADASNKSDAMTVLFDGTTTIAGDLTINSDARLKSNIISLGSTLAKLLALDGKSYTLKADESKQKIGLLAQDVQEVFPELVKEASDEQGTLSVNYQGLIPVLINAIKEQQKEIEELKIEVNKLRNQ